MKKICIICNKSMETSLLLNNIQMLKCGSCGLIRREVFDIPDSYYKSLDAKDLGSKRTARERNSLNRIDLFKKNVPLNNWCDIGTGEGIFLEVLKKSGGSGVGVEPSESSRIKAKQNGVSIVGNSLNDIVSIAKNNKIEVISLFHVIEHLENPEEALKAIYSALPKDGYLIIETPNIDSWVFKACNFKNKLIYPEHLWYFSFKTLKKLLLNNKFKIVSSGKRDFDQNNFTIRESLNRLGILHNIRIDNSKKIFINTTQNKAQEPRQNTFRTVVRKVLNAMVVMTGRLQYMYFVVQKK